MRAILHKPAYKVKDSERSRENTDETYEKLKEIFVEQFNHTDHYTLNLTTQKPPERAVFANHLLG